MGCVATRDIEEGELIVSEEPTLLLGSVEKKRGVSIIAWNQIKHTRMHLEKCVTSQEAYITFQEAYTTCQEAYMYIMSGSKYYMSGSK